MLLKIANLASLGLSPEDFAARSLTTNCTGQIASNSKGLFATARIYLLLDGR